MGFDPATLTIASMGASALGSIAQGRAASNSAKYNAAVAANNAIIADQNAKWASQEGNAKVSAQGIRNAQNMGTLKANQGASGVTVGTGSNAEVQASQAAIGQLDAMTIRSNAAREAYGYLTQSNSFKAQEQLDRSQAKYAKQAGYLGAANSLLNQGAQASRAGVFDAHTAGQSLNSSALDEYGPYDNSLPWRNEGVY